MTGVNRWSLKHHYKPEAYIIPTVYYLYPRTPGCEICQLVETYSGAGHFVRAFIQQFATISMETVKHFWPSESETSFWPL